MSCKCTKTYTCRTCTVNNACGCRPSYKYDPCKLPDYDYSVDVEKNTAAIDALKESVATNTTDLTALKEAIGEDGIQKIKDALKALNPYANLNDSVKATLYMGEWNDATVTQDVVGGGTVTTRIGLNTADIVKHNGSLWVSLTDDNKSEPADDNTTFLKLGTAGGGDVDLTDIEADIDALQTAVDDKADKNGSTTEVFKVATAVASEDAVNKAQMDAAIGDLDDVYALKNGDAAEVFKVADGVDDNDALNVKQHKASTGLVAEFNTTYNGVGATDHPLTVPAMGKYLLVLEITRNHPNFPNDEGATVFSYGSSADAGISIKGKGTYVHSDVPIDTVTRSIATQYVENTTSGDIDIVVKLDILDPADGKFGGHFGYELIKIGDL